METIIWVLIWLNQFLDTLTGNLARDDAASHDSNDHFSIKKQMIRYLSRVADRNKPLFVFN